MVTVSLRTLIVWGMNEVVVGRHGLILRENEATGARKAFRYKGPLGDHKKTTNVCTGVKNVVILGKTLLRT